MRRREFIVAVAGAATWPLAVRAQQRAIPVIGFISSRSPEDSVFVLAAFQQGLAESALVEGKDFAIDFRWAYGAYDRLPALAAELVNRQVAVIVAVGGDPSARAAKAATSMTPIVIAATDPIKSGLVASLNQPGGNATGVYVLTADLEQKRLGLLGELFPGPTPFAVLLNPKFAPTAEQAVELVEAARTMGRPVIIFNASTDGELDAAFFTLARQRVTAMLVASDPFFDTRRNKIITFAAQQKLPAMYQFREYALAGGLMSYGINLAEGYHAVGNYAARILKGDKPAELPVLQSSKFELVINLKTAKALGFEFPPTFSARADEVIE
jgi:putative ABC transport system substrate-binding protein